jgi:hypothetical protein
LNRRDVDFGRLVVVVMAVAAVAAAIVAAAAATAVVIVAATLAAMVRVVRHSAHLYIDSLLALILALPLTVALTMATAIGRIGERGSDRYCRRSGGE